MFLGLDLSLSGTGMCLMSDWDHHAYNVDLVQPKGLLGVDRLRYIIEAIEQFIVVPPKLVAIEGYAFGVMHGHLANLGELGGLVRYKLAEWGYPHIVVGTTQLKKFIVGKGNEREKGAVMMSVLKNFGEEFKNNNKCDAYGLALVAMAYYGNPTFQARTKELQVAQADVLKKIKEDPTAVLTKKAKDKAKRKAILEDDEE